MQSLYLMSVAFSCAMLVTLANVTTPLLQTTADSTDVSTSPVAETTVLSISTTQLSTSTPQLSTSSKLAASTTKMSTSTTGHSSQATTPMKSSAYVKKSTTSTHTKQSITSNVVSSTNPPPSPSNAIKPSSIPITVTTSSTAPSTSTSQTSPSPVTSTSQTSPTTSPVTSTSPSTATSTKQASPTTSLSPSRSPSTATPTSQTSPISTTETTTISTTSTTETTTFVPRYSPADLSNTTVEVTLVVIVNGSFTDVPNNRSSQNYTAFADKFKASLTEFYKDILGNRFKGIIINGFSKGNIIKCNYTVELKAPTNKPEAKAVLDNMTNASWSLFNATGIPGPVLVNETRNKQKKVLKEVDILLHVRGGDKVCGKQAVLRYGQHNNGTVICVYKCDDIKKHYCGDYGYCVVTYTGDVKCLCKDHNNNVYYGDFCKKTVPVHAPTTVKTVVVTESLSRTDIIAIAAGTGGGLVLLLLISLVCVCRKLQSSKKRNKFYSYMGNDKEALHSENSRIENVPNIKNDHTNMAYVRDTDYMQLQRFEPEGKNVNHETGQRQGYERDEKSYRKVEAPDVGNVTIYQPSHLKEPIDRQSGASKFDREEVQSYPFHTMDTEKSYKIRRPTVNSDTSIPYN